MTHGGDLSKKVGVVTTPDSWEELRGWLRSLHGPERRVAWIAAIKGWNLALSLMEKLNNGEALKEGHASGDILESP